MFSELLLVRQSTALHESAEAIFLLKANCSYVMTARFLNGNFSLLQLTMTSLFWGRASFTRSVG